MQSGAAAARALLPLPLPPCGAADAVPAAALGSPQTRQTHPGNTIDLSPSSSVDPQATHMVAGLLLLDAQPMAEPSKANEAKKLVFFLSGSRRCLLITIKWLSTCN